VGVVVGSRDLPRAGLPESLKWGVGVGVQSRDVSCGATWFPEGLK